MNKFSLHEFFLKNYEIIFKVLGSLIFIVILSYVLMKVYKKLHPKFVRSKRFWDDALIRALYSPLQLAIWFNGAAFILRIATQNIKFFDWIESFRKIGLVLIFLWFFIRFIRQLEKNLFKISLSPKGKIDKTSLRAISQLLRLATIIVAALILLQTFGIPISGIVAFGGFSGIALGFAAKDMLGNFFGGLMIFLDRPFVIGDWIRSPDKEIEGTVEQIGWRLTLIRTFDKRPLYVPNGVFSNISLENASRMQNRRIKTTLGLRYDDAFKLAPLLQDVEKMLKNHPEIDQTKTCFVNLIKFGHFSLEILVYTFTKTTKWVLFQQIQQDVFLKIIEIIKNHGAECAFPTSTIHIPDNLKIEK